MSVYIESILDMMKLVLLYISCSYCRSCKNVKKGYCSRSDENSIPLQVLSVATQVPISRDSVLYSVHRRISTAYGAVLELSAHAVLVTFCNVCTVLYSCYSITSN